MVTDFPEHTNGNDSATPKKNQKNTNPLNLWPVAAEASGEGLPYAPENWPNPGDTWGWRTGKRTSPSGYFRDRYLYPPARIARIDNSGSSRRKHIFPSKFSVERYIRAAFPDADVDGFFASFSWKIPALHSNIDQQPIAAVPLQQIKLQEQTEPDWQSDTYGCKVGNKMCNSLVLEEVEKYSPAMPCEICCAEPSFCRDCTCILCCQTVDSAYGGYSYIKCPAKVRNDNICGHIAHIECALRSHLAGTVDGNIRLDAEYLCRRCDGRVCLIHYVSKLIETCKVINSRNDIEKILNLGARILRGSQKPIAKVLLQRIELAISKTSRRNRYDRFDHLCQLHCGTRLEDICKVDDDHTAQSIGISKNHNATREDTVNGSLSEGKKGKESHDYLSESLKLEHEMDQVLQALRKSQELEYNMAKERLHQQRNRIHNFYRQLISAKTELARQNSSHSDAMLQAVREREDQITQEINKFKDMEKVANGFGRTSKDILKEHFGLEIEDSMADHL